MNKRHRLAICLCGSVPIEEICDRIELGNNVAAKRQGCTVDCCRFVSIGGVICDILLEYFVCTIQEIASGA